MLDGFSRRAGLSQSTRRTNGHYSRSSSSRRQAMQEVAVGRTDGSRRRSSRPTERFPATRAGVLRVVIHGHFLPCVRRLSRRQTRQEAADPAAPAWIRWRGGRIEAEEHEADEEVAEDGGRGAAGVVNGEN